MRFFLFLFCFSFLSYGQEINLNPFFVWAENGLSLRSEPRVDSEKITTIPFGSSLQFISYDSNTYTTEEFKGFKHTSKWMKVAYKSFQGYVVSDYTSMLKTPSTELQNASLLNYLKNTFKLLDTKIITTYSDDCQEQDCAKEYILTFENGIVHTYWEEEGGGTETLSLPKSNMLHGFLLAAKYCDMYKEFETVYSKEPLPYIRVLRNDIGCDFSITSLDELVIIVWSGGC
jgi:hypothetical protein